MSFTYYLLVTTFLLVPIVGFLCATEVLPSALGIVLKYSLGFFLLYDVACYFSYSIKGTYPDYIIFSLQYLWFCTLVCAIKWHGLWNKLLKVAGCSLIGLGYIIGVLSIGFFMLFADAMESDRQYYAAKDKDEYEIRGLPGKGFDAIYDSYNFNVYRKMGILEYYTGTFRLTSDDQTPFDFENGLQFNIVDDSNVRHLVMKDKNGRQHTEQLK